MAGYIFIAKFWRWAFLSKNPVPQKYIKFKTLVKDNFDWQYNADVTKDAFAPIILTWSFKRHTPDHYYLSIEDIDISGIISC